MQAMVNCLWAYMICPPILIRSLVKRGNFNIVFSPDFRTLAFGRENGSIELWDVGTATRSRELKGHTTNISALAFTEHGEVLASVDKNGVLRTWDVSTGKDQGSIQVSPQTNHLQFAASGMRLLTGDGTSVQLWDVTSGQSVLNVDS